jgi:glycosidase
MNEPILSMHGDACGTGANLETAPTATEPYVSSSGWDHHPIGRPDQPQAVSPEGWSSPRPAGVQPTELDKSCAAEAAWLPNPMGGALQRTIDRRRFLKYGAALFLAPTAITALSSRSARAAVNYSHPAWSVNAPVYEINPYFHAQSTRLTDVIPHLDAIADLGVEILWIMPVYQRGGASMYCVYNYTAVDTELGTFTDLKSLVDRAHALGMKVILDFVPLHTANNHPWIQQHPGWYDRDSNGNIVHRWPDVSQLAWFNADTTRREELWAEMERIVTYWVQNADVDGFRWDVGLDIPEAWFTRVRESLQAIKPVFFLGEGKPAYLHPENDMSYDWDLPARFKDIAVGGQSATILDTHLNAENNSFGAITPTPYRMRYTLNHDISYSNEGEFADYGGQAATLAFEVLSVTLGPRTKPMIYSGQEVGIRTPLGGTNRVTTNPSYGTSPLRAFYRRLFTLYKNNPALRPKASFTKFNAATNDRIYAFGRRDVGGTMRIVFVANLSSSGRNAGVTVPDDFRGTYTDLETGASVGLGPSYSPALAAWEYHLLGRQDGSSQTTQRATFSIDAGTDDQEVLRSGLRYPPEAGTFRRQATGTTVEASKNYQGSGGYYVRNALLRWDTSSIPDNATITKATLRFWCTVKNPSEARNFVAEYWGWDGNSQSDWSATPPAAPVFQVPVAGIANGAQNSVTFTNLGGISKTGWTLIRCHIDGGIPRNYNYVVMSSSESTNPEPQLIVEYTTP